MKTKSDYTKIETLYYSDQLNTCRYIIPPKQSHIIEMNMTHVIVPINPSKVVAYVVNKTNKHINDPP